MEKGEAQRHGLGKVLAIAAAAAAKSLQSCLTLRPHGWQPTRFLHPWDSPGKSTGVGCHGTGYYYHLIYSHLHPTFFGKDKSLENIAST